MILYTDSEGKIKSVDTPINNLAAYKLTEDNPFVGWSAAKICCYRVNLTPETIQVKIGTKEENYIDLEGNEQIRTIDIFETQETGKYIVTMMTPYVDTRILEHINQLGNSSDTLLEYLSEILEQICELQLTVELLNTLGEEE